MPTKPTKSLPESKQGKLKINELFHSLQGEARDAGKPTVFIRLTGCPLRCVYCDSEYAFHGGEWMHIDQIMEKTAAYETKYVCVTGGEPLAQKRCHELLGRVVDIKTPDSGEVESNLWSNLDILTPHDQIKFVICSRADYDWAVAEIRSRDLEPKLEILFSPAWGQLDATQLAEWVLQDQLNVRVQIQLHKLLWGDVPGK